MKVRHLVPLLAALAAPAGCGTASGRLVERRPPAPGAAAPRKVEGPVSYARDLVPILKASCAGCHCPAKKEGKLMLTTWAAFKAGGKKGAGFVPGDPDRSGVVKMISGEKPQMPKNADPLAPEDVELFVRWIREGAKNDTPPAPPAPSADNPPVYTTTLGVSALAWSPDGSLLAVSGFHEVLLHRVEGLGPAAAAAVCACKPGCACPHCGSGGKNACGCGKPQAPAGPAGDLLIAPAGRLIGGSPRIESLAFSADGKWLAVAGGNPTEFGEIQIWDVAAQTLAKSYHVSTDVLYGISFSPDATQVAVGGADKSVRVIAVADGKEIVKFDNHSDWVLGTAFTRNGKRLVSASRDRALKLINVENGQLIDDINKLLEPVMCVARHPTEDIIAYGGKLGTARIYRISDNQGRTAANNDTNLLRELEREPWPIRAIAYSPDGATLAVGGAGEEVRLYAAKDGSRTAVLAGHPGAVYAVAFHPGGRLVATGGFDGRIRFFDLQGKPVKTFVPVPLQQTARP